MHGDLIFKGGARTPIACLRGDILEGNVEVQIQVAASGAPQPEFMEMRFYPALDMDPGGSWTCECGKPTQGDGHDWPGHWVVKRTVDTALQPGPIT